MKIALHSGKLLGMEYSINEKITITARFISFEIKASNHVAADIYKWSLVLNRCIQKISTLRETYFWIKELEEH